MSGGDCQRHTDDFVADQEGDDQVGRVLEQGSHHAANHAAALSQAFDLDCIKRKEEPWPRSKKAEQTSRMPMSRSLTSSTLSNAASSKHHDPQANAHHTDRRERQQYLPGHVHQLIDPQSWQSPAQPHHDENEQQTFDDERQGGW